VKKALSGCARWKFKKARASASEAETWGIQQPGNASAPKQGETSTETSKRPRSENSTPTEMARTPERTRDFSEPGTYKEALTIIKITILKETYPEDKLNDDNQTYFWRSWERCYVGLSMRTTTPKVLQARERRIFLQMRRRTV
jgi:hypothetical protein